MNIDKIAASRQKRLARKEAPGQAFLSQFLLWYNAVEEVHALNVSPGAKWLIQRALVISSVTAFEVYFRDILDAIFRLCRPDVFQSKLRELHKQKYDIDEIVAIYQQGINPCELVMGGLSFQRMDTIEMVFKCLIGKPFWKSVVPVAVRLAEDHSKTFEVTEKNVESLGKLLQLRHELVHDPDRHKHELEEEEEGWIAEAGTLIFACNILLSDFIEKNLDPEIAAKSGMLRGRA